MRLHWLQHVPFEGLGFIHDWAASLGAEITCTRLFAGETLPGMADFDLLVVMGGPMGVHDHANHPWLITEKKFIRQAIDADKRVLGICLGAQLIADALDAKVIAGPQKEIGWYPVQREDPAPYIIPDGLIAFHWHGDTFDIPAGAIRLASSEACCNQGFVYDNRVVALQFHLETTAETMEALVKNCEHELVAAPFIQSAEQMRNGAVHFEDANRAMKSLLDQLIS
jgi:GMP synthase-like glutamine amidotransferase